MKHVYQAIAGDGDTNKSCSCDRNYNHTSTPYWTPERRAEVLRERLAVLCAKMMDEDGYDPGELPTPWCYEFADRMIAEMERVLP